MNSRWVFVALLTAWLSIAGGGLAAAATGTDIVTVLVPAFTGDLDRGRGASYVLKLQVQAAQSLYDVSKTCAPVPTGGNLAAPTSRGEIVWIPGQLEKPDPSEAKKLAILGGAQAVLWGTLSVYPDGVLVSPFVTVADAGTDLRLRRPERRSMQTPFGVFALGHPTPTQSFDPLFVAAADIDKYSYSHLKLCAKGGACVSPGDTYRITRALAVDASSGAITLRFEQKQYALSAGALIAKRGRLVQYLAGLTAFLRGQDNLSACQFSQIATDDDAPGGIRADAYYYKGLMDLGQGRCPLQNFQNAYQQNDASFVMARALQISRHAAICSGEAARSEADPSSRAALSSAAAVIRLRLAEKPDAALQSLVDSD